MLIITICKKVSCCFIPECFTFLKQVSESLEVILNVWYFIIQLSLFSNNMYIYLCALLYLNLIISHLCHAAMKADDPMILWLLLCCVIPLDHSQSSLFLFTVDDQVFWNQASWMTKYIYRYVVCSTQTLAWVSVCLETCSYFLEVLIRVQYLPRFTYLESWLHCLGCQV